MIMVSPQKERVQEAWDKFQELQAKADNGTLGTGDLNKLEFLRIEISLIQAEAMVTLALRQQGPW